MSEAADCARAEQALAESLGRTDGPTAVDVDVSNHVAGCARCTAFAGQMKDVLETLRADDVPDPGTGYWQGFSGRVRRSLEEAPAAGRVWTRWPAWAGLAAAAVLAVALIRLPAGDETLPQSTNGDAAVSSATSVVQVDGTDDDGSSELDLLLDDFFGEAGYGSVSDSVGRLDDDGRQQLLEALQAELEASA